MKERLCLEVERLRLGAVIMGSRGFGAVKRAGKGRLGSVSDYCVQHCVCPVVVVRYPEEKDGVGVGEGEGSGMVGEEAELEPVPEEEQEYHDASDEQNGLSFNLCLMLTLPSTCRQSQICYLQTKMCPSFHVFYQRDHVMRRHKFGSVTSIGPIHLKCFVRGHLFIGLPRAKSNF